MLVMRGNWHNFFCVQEDGSFYLFYDGDLHAPEQHWCPKLKIVQLLFLTAVRTANSKLSQESSLTIIVFVSHLRNPFSKEKAAASMMSAAHNLHTCPPQVEIIQ